MEQDVEEACQNGSARGHPQDQVGQQLEEDAALEVQGTDHEVEAERQDEEGDHDGQGREAVDAEEVDQDHGEDEGANESDRFGGEQHRVELVRATVPQAEGAVALQFLGGLGGAGVGNDLSGGGGASDLGHGVFAFSETEKWGFEYSYI